jgi:hypothetical protein
MFRSQLDPSFLDEATLAHTKKSSHIVMFDDVFGLRGVAERLENSNIN